MPTTHALVTNAGARAAPRVARGALMIALTLATLACEPELTRAYGCVVRLTSEPGRSLEGARATLGGEVVGVSDAHGAIPLELHGREGDLLSLQIECPSGHHPPPDLLVPLRQVRDGARPEFSVRCVPTTRSLVVALRADHGPHLPLLHLGRELARTDESGAAHLALDIASDDVVELVLDTSGEPRLRPRSPVFRLQPGVRDEITALRQEFTLLSPPPVKRRVDTPRGPVRLD